MTAYTNRHNAKRDENEKGIVSLLKGMGFSVERLNKPLDLVLGYRGQTRLAEVKMPKNDLSESQQEFADGWRGGKIWVLRTPKDVREMWINWPDGETK